MKITPNQEVICEWPNKTLKKVMVTSIDQQNNTAFIIWNEKHSPIGEQGCVVGLEDTVPLNWLYSKN